VEELSELLERRSEEANKGLYDFLSKNVGDFEKMRDEGSVAFPFELLPEFKEFLSKVSIYRNTLQIVHDGYLLSLIARWDFFISSILRVIYQSKPDLILATERSLSFAELFQISSIHEARMALIEQEIESVIRKSHIDHFVYLEKKLGIELRKGLEVWPDFVEITQRRHLIAHTGGRITAQYRAICAEVGVNPPEVEKKRSRLRISKGYVQHACDVLTELGAKLGFVLARKLFPGDIIEIDGAYSNIAFDLLTNNRFGPIINMLQFYVKDVKRHGSKRQYLIGVINLAQAFKWMQKDAACNAVLDREDWSTCSDDFILCRAVLKGDFAQAAAIMRRIGRSGLVSQSDYDRWPIFRQFRETNEFASAYRDIFGSSTTVGEIDGALDSEDTQTAEAGSESTSAENTQSISEN
jgi:hypothetical protein